MVLSAGITKDTVGGQQEEQRETPNRMSRTLGLKFEGPGLSHDPKGLSLLPFGAGCTRIVLQFQMITKLLIRKC